MPDSCPKTGGGAFYVKFMANKFTNFFKDIKIEMQKVSWPSKDELVGSTIVVLVSLTILSAFIGVCDVILSKIVNIIMTAL